MVGIYWAMKEICVAVLFMAIHVSVHKMLLLFQFYNLFFFVYHVIMYRLFMIPKDIVWYSKTNSPILDQSLMRQKPNNNKSNKQTKT